MKKSKNRYLLINIFILISCFSFFVLSYRLCHLALSKEVDGVDLKEFAKNRSVVEATIKARRGAILDTNGAYLARNVSSYTLIAYLDPKRSENEAKLYHVKDKENTAKELAKVIDMKEEEILAILKQEGLYQVEFGYKTKNLTELEKEQIEKLHLPGIDFIEDEKRYYPNGNFLSYTLGYARKNENGKIAGEMGIEELLDPILSGTDGKTTYQKDLNGYRIAGTKELTTPADDGSNIYLTIDSNIELFVEQAMNEAFKKYKPEWMTITVADAKTGKILATSQAPSFDPNVLDIDKWLNLAVSDPYEPGSIMKIYTYMAAMENGTYVGSKKFTSGRYITDDKTSIYDWYRKGWGNITYDDGFIASSNVGIINIINNFINKDVLSDYFKKMGFGEKTGITLANEASGKVSFNYQTEVYNAGFGQGITTTPMQHIQALTSIANDGVMLKPYIIEKIVDNEGNILYKGEKEEKGVVASHETVEKIKQLMYDVVHSNWSGATGDGYRLKGYDLIGKTGTSQLVNPTTGKYYTDDYNTIRSFVGMWPKKDPKVIIYASAKRSSSYALTQSVKEIVKNTSKYLNIFNGNDEKVLENFTVDSYINKNTKDVIKQLEEANVKKIVIGNGNKIINQYPSKNSILDTNEKIILLTNDTTYLMPSFIEYSKKDAMAICNMIDIKCSFTGYGYVTSQSIKVNTKIDKTKEQKLILKEKYKT